MSISGLSLPEPPRTMFASDNASGIHPAYLEAITSANVDHQLAYGSDPLSSAAEQMFQNLCGVNVEVLMCFGGTGANVLALSMLLERGESVMCTDKAHIAVDETGAPEKFLGAKLHSVAALDGKLQADDIHRLARELGNIHHVQPGVVSISQPTELGTLYSLAEISEIVSAAHSYNMRVHLDGARIANAVVALGNTSQTFRAMTFDLGVDAVSFGGTKNAMWNAEAVLLAPHIAATHGSLTGAIMRKQVTQLPSKMRFTAAQFIRSFTDDLWLETAQNANDSAHVLWESLSDISALQLSQPAVNSLYPILSDPAKSILQQWCFFWDWDRSRDQVRWMTSWDTTQADIALFSTAVRQVLGL